MDDFNKALASLKGVGGVPEIDKLYEPEYAASLASNKTREAGARADVDVANANIARRDRISELESELDEVEALKDPSKYQKVKRQDGGFDFYNPRGEKIPAGLYAQVQGKSIADVFDGSDNLYENEFINDYKSLRELGTAWNSGDTEKIKKILGVDTDKDGKISFTSDTGKQVYEQLQKGKTFEQLTKEFLDSYKDIFQEQNLGSNSGSSQSVPLSAPSQSIGDRFRGVLNRIPGVNLESDPYR